MENFKIVNDMLQYLGIPDSFTVIYSSVKLMPDKCIDILIYLQRQNQNGGGIRMKLIRKTTNNGTNNIVSYRHIYENTHGQVTVKDDQILDNLNQDELKSIFKELTSF